MSTTMTPLHHRSHRPTPARQRVRRLGAAAAALALAAAAAPALAQLQPRDIGQDGSIEAWYDSARHTTWLASTQAAAGSAQDDGSDRNDGLLTWAAAQAWVAGLQVAGVGGWRLPGIDTGCNGSGTGYGCSAGELGHQFHTNLGGRSGLPLSITSPASAARFTGLADRSFWAQDSYAQDPEQAGVFLFSEGWQDYAFKAFSEHAVWAVHDGDALAAAVPEPATLLSMLAGLAGLGSIGRRRPAKRSA